MVIVCTLISRANSIGRQTIKTIFLCCFILQSANNNLKCICKQKTHSTESCLLFYLFQPYFKVCIIIKTCVQYIFYYIFWYSFNMFLTRYIKHVFNSICFIIEFLLNMFLFNMFNLSVQLYNELNIIIIILNMI